MTTSATDDVCQLIGHDHLLPIAPMIYVAWADGQLSADEIRAIRRSAAQRDWLDQDAQGPLANWLDPERPPTATKLAKLGRAIAAAAGELSPKRRFTLAELGVRIAGQAGPGEEPEWIDADVHRALLDLEKSLGVVSEDATRALLHGLETGGDVGERTHFFDEPAANFDVDQMTELLDGQWASVWHKTRQVLTGEGFDYVGDVSTQAYRQQVLEWLEILADQGLGQIEPADDAGIGPQMGRFMATFEALGMFDLNLVVKFGVQFGLFGGSILFLGTDHHHNKYLDDIASLDVLGGFAMTERGHGSNVRGIRTTASYDADTEQFVIDTPDDDAFKEWIGNAAVDGHVMTVFAQLVIDGQEFGVHAFVVPVRDADGRPLAGVRLEDCGHKMGLNGVDNGRIWFDEVSVPRQNLLDRYAQVSADGQYSSPIASAGKRFFTMLGTLVAGRISVGAAALTATKSSLAIATRYSAMRRQFGPAGQPEKPVLNYPTHQRRLMPRIATSYALHFAVQKLRQRYVATRGDDDTRDVEAMAAAIKAFSTWHAIEAIQLARECCGGMGFLSQNRIAVDRKDVDVFATFEGDNTVLMMLVARSLLSGYQRHFEDASLFSMARFLAGQAAENLQSRNPLVTGQTSPDHLCTADFQLEIFKAREDHLLGSAARRLKSRLDDGMDSFEAFNQVQSHLLSLSKAHAQRVVLECFAERIGQLDDHDPLAKPLGLMRNLFAMDYLHRDIGWFLENGYVEPPKARAIRDLVESLCAKARRQALPLVDAWGIPDDLLGAPIAFPSTPPAS